MQGRYSVLFFLSNTFFFQTQTPAWLFPAILILEGSGTVFSKGGAGLSGEHPRLEGAGLTFEEGVHKGAIRPGTQT